MASAVPSLKVLQKEIGSDMGAISLLRTAMQMIQRWIFHRYSHLIKSSVVALLISSKAHVLSHLCVAGLSKSIVWSFFSFASNMYTTKTLNPKPKPFMYSVFSRITLSSSIHRWEFKVNHEGWLTTANPNLGPATAARTKAALETTSHLLPLLQRIKDEARYAINDLLKVMCSCRNVGRNLTLQV